MAANEDYELIEVPTSRKIEIKVTLDGLLDELAERAGSIAGGSQQASPQVVDHLKRLSELARELKGEVGEASRDANVLDRLQGRP
jgi:hypothetical protein